MKAKPKQTRQSPKGDAKRAALISAAAPVFAKVGIHNLTLKRLADEIKTPSPVLLYHFASLEELFEEVLRFKLTSGREVVGQSIAQAQPGIEAIEGWVHGMFDWLTSSSETHALFLQLYSLTPYNQKLKDFNAQIVEVGQNRIRSVLATAKEQGLIFCPSVEDTGLMMGTLIMGVMIKMFLMPEKLEVFRLRKLVFQACLQLITEKK